MSEIKRETMKAREVADLLGICVDTVYALVRMKQLPHYRPPGTRILLFRRESILNYLRDQEQKSVSA